MPQRVVVFLGFTLALTACASRAPRHQADAQPSAKLDAAYSCVVSSLIDAGYPAKKDKQRLAVSGQFRQDLSPGEVQSMGGTVGSGGDPRDLRDPPVPYEVDGVTATVSLDRTGAVKIDAEAYTGVGSSARGGYVKRSASARGASAVKKMEGCADLSG